MTALNFAANTGKLDVVEYLLHYEKDANPMKWTPLHSAAENGHIHIIRHIKDMYICE